MAASGDAETVDRTAGVALLIEVDPLVGVVEEEDLASALPDWVVVLIPHVNDKGLTIIFFLCQKLIGLERLTEN